MRKLATMAQQVMLAATFMIALAGGASAEKVYTIGVVPQFGPKKIAAIWNPIIEELEARTGLKFKLVGSPRIPEFEDSFLNGAFDFAYMNPYHFLLARNSQGYVPLVNDGGRMLFGIVVVAKDSPIDDIEDLDGKKIAFPVPNALGASLMIRAVLDRDYGVKFTPVYSATHSASYLNAAVGDTDAAGGVMVTLKRQNDGIKKNLKVIFETSRVPPHPFAAHPSIPVEDHQKVKQAILEMSLTEEGKAMLAKIPMKKAVDVTAEAYDVLNELQLGKYYEK